MKRHFIKLLSLCLASICTIFCFGCEGNTYVESSLHEVKPVYKYTIKAIGEDVIPVLGFVGPHVGVAKNGAWIDSINTDEVYKAISESGCNIIQSFLDYSVIPQDVINSFNLASKYNMCMTCYDTTLWSIQGTNIADQDVITQRYQELSQYEGFLGLNTDDEPFSRDMPNILTAIGRIKEAAKTINGGDNIYFGSCLNPKWAYIKYDEQYPNYSYQEYLQSYIDAASPRHIGYDFYPFLGTEAQDVGTIREGYFENIVEVREVAERNKIPFWTYVQCCTYEPETVREPTEGEIWWDFNTALAFGAKGFGLYSLCEPENYSTVHTSMIGLYGEKRSSYFYVQSAMKEIKAIEHVIMNSHNDGVMVCGKSMDVIPGSVILNDYRELKGVSGSDSIVGCFDYKGKTVLYVVNNSFIEDKAQVKLSFDKCYGYDVIQRGITRSTNGKELTIKLAAGEGALISLR